jgi:hypothetical protein
MTCIRLALISPPNIWVKSPPRVHHPLIADVDSALGKQVFRVA